MSSKPALHPGQLKEYFLKGCKNISDFAVGVEWEKIGVDGDTGRAIPYSGPRGVKVIFEDLIKKYGWQVALRSSDGQPIALKKGETNITLEPGGQIELSGAKAKNISQNAQELFSHLTEIKEISLPLGIVWLGLGAQPFSTAEDIEWVPKDRYQIMRQRLLQKGSKTFSMMKETASVQVSVDYSSEEDAVEKLRLAMALAPFLTAMFANSPIEGGKISPFLSRRADIWRHTAPERSGCIWEAFRPDFSFQDYVEYALDVPLLFIRREGQWMQTDEMPFRRFLESGWKDYDAEAGDWELHLSSIFTEARLKNYLEIRSIDCQGTPVGLSAVAFIKGLFYNAEARKKAWQLLGGLALEERKRLFSETPQKALKTAFGGGTLLEPCRTLLAISRAGLEERERPYLIPIEILLDSKHCPAERMLEWIKNTDDPACRLRTIIRFCAV